MPHPRFILRALFMAMLVAGCFLGGILFERERRRREDEATVSAVAQKLLDEKLCEIAALRKEILNEQMRAKSLLHSKDGQSVDYLRSELVRCEKSLKQLRGY
jgi:hypothetical protein